METHVFLAVLLAALLHASWNALVKASADKHLGMAAVVIGHAPPALLALPFVPTINANCWPYLLSGALLHVGYQLFLLNSYRFGDLTQVYPVARGSAPLLVVVLSMLILGNGLSIVQITAVAVVSVGIMSLALVTRGDGQFDGRGVLLALFAGCFISGYSVNDGIGARIAESPIAFYSVLALLNAIAWIPILLVAKPGALGQILGQGRKAFIIGGTGSYIAYAIVVWAFTQAPISNVVALRETSVIFALLIGTLFLREHFTGLKVVATLVTLCGVILLRLTG